MRDEIAADSLSVEKYLVKEGARNQLIWFYNEGKAISRFVERCSCDHGIFPISRAPINDFLSFEKQLNKVGTATLGGVEGNGR